MVAPEFPAFAGILRHTHLFCRWFVDKIPVFEPKPGLTLPGISIKLLPATRARMYLGSKIGRIRIIVQVSDCFVDHLNSDRKITGSVPFVLKLNHI